MYSVDRQTNPRLCFNLASYKGIKPERTAYPSSGGSFLKSEGPGVRMKDY